MSKTLSLSLLFSLMMTGASAQSKPALRAADTKSAGRAGQAQAKPAETKSRPAAGLTETKSASAPRLSTEELYRTIARLDAEVFDAAYRCQLEKFGALFAEDLEFYHDKDGLLRSRAALVEAVKNLCHKVRRVLVPGTLEVHPLEGYGAVQIGVHRFEHPGREKEDGVGEARFIHLWRLQDGKWQITRVISYDHHAVVPVK